MITVYDFCEMCIEECMLKVEIWDAASESVVFSGLCADIDDELGCAEVMTFDPPVKANTICLNIDTSY